MFTIFIDDGRATDDNK
jgi:hypothetical protein